MEEHYRILRKPLVTEKSATIQQESNRVTFGVHPDANKIQIKNAIEKIFGVKVLSVNTSMVQSKKRRYGRNVGYSKKWKKAIALLKEGDKIELFEGV
ncbi:MAG: 50S ribosomal protein L23 [Candidatus Nitrohelix vancouverensis]|uniref:Large ribosomal subunit protein uL23 n=1 Tax=Candidatus Nitrohelix vancouverensis TaxID=2705534 RepID=A0A7T0G2E9_9BACT|nr:MAG: 50S ribosomal protein L23 [Candidatus Nitrohelix vancouverensis]